MALLNNNKYVRISWLNGEYIAVSVYADREHRDAYESEEEYVYPFVYNYTGTPIERIAQGYMNLKTLPEFINATDC